MARRKSMRVGAVQFRIMEVLWKRGCTKALEITEELCRKKRIAHSTVQTLLRMLERKGAIAHHIEERAFIFYPLVTREEVLRSSKGTSFPVCSEVLHTGSLRTSSVRIWFLWENSRGLRN